MGSHFTTYNRNKEPNNNDTRTCNVLPIRAYPCALSAGGQLFSEPEYDLVLTAATEATEEYSGDIIAVTDASVIDGYGTWAAILTDPVGRELCQAQGSISCEGLTSFRAELDGCRGVLQLF